MKKTQVVFILMMISPIITIAQNHIMIFKDKSKSYTSNPNQSKYLKSEINAHLKKGTNTFQISFINGNTSSIKNSKTFHFDRPSFDSSEFSEDDLEIEKILFKNKIKRRVKKISKKITAFINSYKTEALHTNIASCIVAISKVKADNIQVYIDTDGIESSNLRKFEIRPIQSKSEALSFSRIDSEKLRQKFNLPKSINNVKEVQFILPREMGKSTKGSAFIDIYFKGLFAQFGITNIHFKIL